jgi:hypothetical protein
MLPNLTRWLSGTTVFTQRGGRSWAPLQEIEPSGWLYWRPKTRDG